MDKELSTLITETKEDLKQLLEAKIELLRLSAYEKALPVALQSAYITMLCVVGLLAAIMLLVTAGFAGAALMASVNADILWSLTWGFGIVALFMLLLLGILVLLRRRTVVKYYRRCIGVLLDDLETAELLQEPSDSTLSRPNKQHHEA